MTVIELEKICGGGAETFFDFCCGRSWTIRDSHGKVGMEINHKSSLHILCKVSKFEVTKRNETEFWGYDKFNIQVWSFRICTSVEFCTKIRVNGNVKSRRYVGLQIDSAEKLSSVRNCLWFWWYSVLHLRGQWVGRLWRRLLSSWFCGIRHNAAW